MNSRYTGYESVLGQRQRCRRERRDRDAVHIVADEDAAQLLEHEDQAEGQQHLVQMVASVQPAISSHSSS